MLFFFIRVFSIFYNLNNAISFYSICFLFFYHTFMFQLLLLLLLFLCKTLFSLAHAKKVQRLFLTLNLDLCRFKLSLLQKIISKNLQMMLGNANKYLFIYVVRKLTIFQLKWQINIDNLVSLHYHYLVFVNIMSKVIHSVHLCYAIHMISKNISPFWF